jgi:ABC-type nitrate/sulfonate/bicarbonate transport system substrate-binding protein
MLNIDERTGMFTLKLLFTVMVLLTTLFLGSCSRKGGSEKMEFITIGMEATAVNSLIYIAEDRGYFSANGLEVVIHDDYPSGAAATEQMLEGEADISTAAELAIVRYAFARKPVLTLGSIDMFMHMKLIGRKDLGVKSVSDLEGKRIGVPIKTAADFKLGRFLDLNGVDKNKISIVDVQAPRVVDALINGTVDAVVTWQPNVMTLQDQLGDRAVTWSVQSKQPMYCLLLTTCKWVQESPDLVKRFLKSIMQAEDYLIQNSAQARAIVQKRLGYDETYLRTIWLEHQFTLRLDQSMILAMEDEARWMTTNNLTSEMKIPDFLDYIYTKSLESVKPGSVNLIRVKENP